MRIIDEIKMSTFKPQLYYTMKGEPLKKLLRFAFISTILGLLFSVLYSLLAGLFMKKFNDVLKSYLSYDPAFLLGTILYMWLGFLISALVLSLIFMAISKFNRYENMNFLTLYNYAIHTLLPCILLTPLFGPFVILFAIGYYFMSVKGELACAKEGVNPAKYLRK